VNHTRFPKEDHLPDWARRDNKDTKGDRAEKVSPFSFLMNKRICTAQILDKWGSSSKNLQSDTTNREENRRFYCSVSMTYSYSNDIYQIKWTAVLTWLTAWWFRVLASNSHSREPQYTTLDCLLEANVAETDLSSVMHRLCHCEHAQWAHYRYLAHFSFRAAGSWQ